MRLRSDRHPVFGPGFALLVFDRPIDAPRLDISILNTVTGLYLGPSAPGRPNWGRQRTTFFPAIRAGGVGSKTFRIGPEVTTYIQEGTYVEIASADGSVREELSWEGVLLRVNAAGTENWTSRPEVFELDSDAVHPAGSGLVGASDLEKLRRDEQEALRHKQEEEDQRNAEQAARARRGAEEEARRRAQEALAADDAESKRVQPLSDETGPATSAAAGSSRATAGKLAKYVLGALVLLAIAGGGYLLYRKADDSAEARAFQRAQDCARGRSCEVAVCTSPYRRDFPQGSHISEINRLDASAGGACPVPTPIVTPSPTATPTRTPPPSPTPTPSPTASPRTTPAPLAQIRRRGMDDKPDTDCSRAAKPIEQMLCYDGDLARADGELGEAYRRRLNSTPDKAALRATENAWIVQREAECNVPASGSWTELQLRQSKGCILRKTRDRIDELNRGP